MVTWMSWRGIVYMRERMWAVIMALVDCGEVGKGAKGGFVAKDDAVELRDLELARGGTGGHVKGEVMAGKNGVGDVDNGSLNGELDRGGIALRKLIA